MDKVLLIVFSLFSTTVSAVSMENRIFSLDANQINFKVGEIIAKDNVFLRIKSFDDIYKLTNKSNVALSEITKNNGILNIALSDGWIMKGRIIAISIGKDTAIIESDELYLISTRLKTQQL